mmetsp:Transcript_17304/g.21995  ORF Transcript_17304/g.21995 Transcript_17304/m.21995 type:complete len:96 (-) Transcript_17304:815-1102(-)
MNLDHEIGKKYSKISRTNEIPQAARREISVEYPKQRHTTTGVMHQAKRKAEIKLRNKALSSGRAKTYHGQEDESLLNNPLLIVKYAAVSTKQHMC